MKIIKKRDIRDEAQALTKKGLNLVVEKRLLDSKLTFKEVLYLEQDNTDYLNELYSRAVLRGKETPVSN